MVLLQIFSLFINTNKKKMHKNIWEANKWDKLMECYYILHLNFIKQNSCDVHIY